MDRTRRPTGPTEVVSSYPTYAEAQRAVDLLSDRDFPVENLSIVAADLRLVEQVTGRLGYMGAGWRGAASGALPGALIGFFFGIFDFVRPLVSGFVLALWGLVIGAVIGAIAGVLSHWYTAGRRDFTSVTGVQAGRYDVVADSPTAAEARRILSETGATSVL